MPWTETCAMDQKVRFVGDWLSGRYSKSELCRVYGISRPTGDKWIGRYVSEGPEGLRDRSREPHRHPNAIEEALCDRIVQAKLAHQSWGPKKLADLLRRTVPEQRWPADSTFGEILKRAGLVQRRRRRRQLSAHGAALSHADKPNAVWSADFKGDFRLGNGQRCYPLTISDHSTRYLLQCRALVRPEYAASRTWFEWTFREYGLPEAIRTDNGPPFASIGLGGLSRLSAWWVRLGIRPERIKPGRPDQNGRHERMHRSLKAATVEPRARSSTAQQRRFDTFVREYNTERSHEALERQTPAHFYRPSPRRYPEKLIPLQYDTDLDVRRVRHNGEIKWRGTSLYLSQTLAGEAVALREIDCGRWEVLYGFHPLGTLEASTMKIQPLRQWHLQTEKT